MKILLFILAVLAPIFALSAQTTYATSSLVGPLKNQDLSARSAPLGASGALLGASAASIDLNPALLTYLNVWEAMASHQTGILDMSQQALWVAGPLASWGWGLSLHNTSYGDFDDRDAMGAVIGQSSLREYSIRLGLAKSWRSLRAGASVLGTQDAVQTQTLLGFDLGLVWEAKENVWLAASGSILSGPQGAAQHMQSSLCWEPYAKDGYHWDLLAGFETFGGSFSQISVGTEAGYGAFAARAGYVLPLGPEIENGPARLGLGLSASKGPLGIDYAFMPRQEPFNATHQVSVNYKFEADKEDAESEEAAKGIWTDGSYLITLNGGLSQAYPYDPKAYQAALPNVAGATSEHAASSAQSWEGGISLGWQLDDWLIEASGGILGPRTLRQRYVASNGTLLSSNDMSLSVFTTEASATRRFPLKAGFDAGLGAGLGYGMLTQNVVLDSSILKLSATATDSKPMVSIFGRMERQISVFMSIGVEAGYRYLNFGSGGAIGDGSNFSCVYGKLRASFKLATPAKPE